MLILTRRPGEVLLIKPNSGAERAGEWFADGPIRLLVYAVRGNQVRIGIEAPKSLQILRGELVEGTEEGKGAIQSTDKP
jgi:carbon storage regulator CsrA